MILARGTVKGGILSIGHRQNFEQRVSTLPDGPVVLTLEDEKEHRSSRALRYYWGVVVKAFCEKYPGYTKEEMHEVLKFKCARILVTDPETGEVHEAGKSTTSMTHGEFTLFVDACIRWAGDLGIPIPYAEEQYV